jgi:CHAT domain-containing protein/Tfp pilus assembly protein PilF
MKRTALVLLLAIVTVVTAAPGVGAQTDERLATATRLQKEATDDYNAGHARDGLPKAREALKLREAVLGPDHLAVAETLQTLGLLVRDSGDLPGARPLFERSLAIRERRFGPQHGLTASSLASLGYLVYLQGDLAAARPMIERALAIRESVLGPNNPAVAFSLNDLGVVLSAQGDYRGARAAYERALAIRERVLGPQHPLTASVLHNLGDLLRETGDRAGARQYLERAIKIREATGNQPGIAAILNSLGFLALMEGDLPGARTSIEKALEIRERALGPEHPATGASLNDLGLVLLRAARYRDAQTALERALRIREKVLGPDHTGVAIILRNLGEVKRTSGDLKGARPLFERSLAIYEKRLGPDHPNTALALHSLAYTMQLQGDLKGARPLFERALAIREKAYGPTHDMVATNLSALAYLSRMEGNRAQARAYGERAVKIREQTLGPDSPVLGWELNSLGQTLRVSGDYAGARPLLERALALAKKGGLGELQWRAESGLGFVNEKTGRLPEAATMFRAAAQTLERTAGQFDEGGRAQYLQGENRLSVYDALARVLLQMHQADSSKGYDREAFAALEAKKGRVVAEALAASQTRVADPKARKDAEEVQAKQSRVAALERALREEQEKSSAAQNAQAIKDLTTRLAQTKSEYLTQVNAFLARYPKFKTLFVDQQTVDPKVLAKFADRLAPGTLVVQYFSAPDALYVFLVAAGGTFQVKTQPVKEDDLYALIRTYREHLKAAEKEPLPWKDDGSAVYLREVAPLKDVTAKLSGHLLRPIAKELSTYTNVVFIPNDLLLYLPIHALTRRVGNEDRFLAETHVVSYLTQLELLDLLAPAKPKIDAPLLALANPDGSLPAASREIRALRGIRKTMTTLEGDRATKQEFLRLASTFTQIHLATHGVLDPERPERSYLLVAGPDEESTHLSISDITGLSLQRALAILSACETAVGEQVPGASLITLAAAFSQAGAEAIVASLWKVNDSSTRDFMVAFHTALGAGQAVALHKAQLAVLGRAATAHPFYWAAFVLIGAR